MWYVWNFRILSAKEHQVFDVNKLKSVKVELERLQYVYTVFTVNTNGMMTYWMFVVLDG